MKRGRALPRTRRYAAIRRKLVVVSFHAPDQGGHFFNELLGYKEAAHALGLAPRILVPRGTEPRLAASLLADPVLDPLIVLGSLDAESIFASVSTYAEATQNLGQLWAALASHDLKSRDILLFTCGHPVLVSGVGQWMARRDRLRRPSVFFRIIGDEFIDGVSGQTTAGAAFFQMACSDLRTRDGQERVFLLGSSPAIVRKAARAGSRRVFLTPLPKHLEFDSSAQPTEPAKPTVYVHLNPRSGEFARSLGDIIRRVVTTDPNVQFVVKPSGLSDASRHALTSDLASLAEILPAEQDTETYLANFRKCTVVLLAYEPSAYRILDSGVFIEAVSFGKPVVVPGGTLMAQKIADGRGVGTTFEGSSIESVTTALLQALGQTHELCAAASALAPRVRFENSSRRYVERMIDLSRQTPDMVPRYEIGDEVDFSEPADSRCFMRNGWGRSESWGVWTVDRQAVLSFTLADDRALVLRALVRPFLTEQHPQMVVGVSVAQQQIDQWVFRLDDPESDQPRWCEARMPSRKSDAGRSALDISFTVDAPSSPESAGLSNDVRTLGFALYKLSLR